MRIKVEIKTRGSYAQVYSGNDMELAKGIKNMLKRQDPRISVLIVKGV